ncbi:MAG TPA: hypothetical protein VLT47_10910 [Anaeromyxobacteraceae bacterium]|nr:hypothetical protein [Anaeromyxobacteraceae bacterium]
MTLPYAPGLVAPSALPPTPDEDPDAWATLHAGTWTIAYPIAFLIEMPGAELKVDNQKAAGKDKAKTKISGVDNAKGSISFRWCRTVPGCDVLMFSFMMGIDPNGPAKGLPLDVNHPEFALRRVSQILPKQWGKLERKGDYRECKLEFTEWTEPDKAVAGATTTPTAAEGATTTIKGFGGNNNTITITGVPVTGFNPGSGSAPTSTP